MNDWKAIFTGDTVFVGGIGAFFEGNAKDMVNIMRRMVKLPPNTLLYPGHEYALNFLPNAVKLDNSIQERLDWALECKKNGIHAAPSSIGDEMKTNCYMRVVLDTISRYFPNVNPTDHVALMEAVYNTV